MGSAVRCHRLSRLAACIFGLCFFFLLKGTCVGQNGIQYEAVLEGVEETALREDLEAISNTFSLVERHPPTMSLLQRRAEGDVPRFLRVLRAQGHYAATVQFTIDEKRKPVRVVFNVAPGPVYPIKSVEIVIQGRPEVQKELPSPEKLEIETGVPAMAETILNDEQTVLNELRRRGFPFPTVADRRVVVDHRSQDVRVSFFIDPGPRARFGAVTVEGLESVEEQFVQYKVPWREGQRFDADLTAKFQRELTETRLFSVVQISYPQELEDEALLPITVTVRERKHRSIRAGLNYSTDLGVGAQASWEHRNLFGGGELFRAGASVSQIDIGLDLLYQKPHFLRRDQTLVYNFKIARDDTDAYTSRNTESALLVDRRLRQGMVFGSGAAFRLSEVEQLDRTDEFVLISIPSHFEWDTSDNLLDPTRGGRLRVQAVPYYDFLERDLGFFRGYVSYTRYIQVSEDPFLVLAGRAAVGSISGARRRSIPADLRFYAGGGGSIRGYPYQTVGPLVGDDPIGGKSLLELSAELRFKVTERIGFVTFFDGGSAFQSAYPDFDETLRWGAGVGVRYYTPIGPLRLDLAFPINPRSGIDDPVQFYLSIGQAF